MKKIQFCSGNNHLPGWENFDSNIDIRKILPFQPESVDFIFIEHGIEHVTQTEAYFFLERCYGILKPGGVIRLTFPDVYKILMDQECQETYSQRWGYNYSKDKTINALKMNIFGWGHLSFWTRGGMMAALAACGFKPFAVNAENSEYEELQNIEQHWKHPAQQLNLKEEEAKKMENSHTTNVEGVKG